MPSHTILNNIGIKIPVEAIFYIILVIILIKNGQCGFLKHFLQHKIILNFLKVRMD
jgi:hypothetical protein